MNTWHLLMLNAGSSCFSYLYIYPLGMFGLSACSSRLDEWFSGSGVDQEKKDRIM